MSKGELTSETGMVFSIKNNVCVSSFFKILIYAAPACVPRMRDTGGAKLIVLDYFPLSNLSINFGSTKIDFSFSTRANPGFPFLGFLTYFAKV